MLNNCWICSLSTGSTAKYDGTFSSERNFSDSGSAANSFLAWASEQSMAQYSTFLISSGRLSSASLIVATASGWASWLTYTTICTPPVHWLSWLSNACWINRVMPNRNSDTIEVITAATVSVRLRVRLAHISRNV